MWIYKGEIPMKKIILSIILCLTIITGISGSAYAYDISPQKPFIGDVQSMNRTFIKDITSLAKSDFPFTEASIVYTENSTYLHITADIFTTTNSGLFYTMPALLAGYYPGKLDFVFIEIRYNGVTTTTIQIDGETATKYASSTIDENEVIKRAKVQDLSKNIIKTNNVNTQSKSDTITSKINGNFRGFKKGTSFKLTNNQIWEQTSLEYEYTYKYSPEVTIYKDGSIYYMLVDGMDTKIQVKKIK